MNVIEPEIIIYFLMFIFWFFYQRILNIRIKKERKLLNFLTEVEILRIGFAVHFIGAKEGISELNKILGDKIYFTNNEKCKIVGVCYSLYKKNNYEKKKNKKNKYRNQNFIK